MPEDERRIDLGPNWRQEMRNEIVRDNLKAASKPLPSSKDEYKEAARKLNEAKKKKREEKAKLEAMIRRSERSNIHEGIRRDILDKDLNIKGE